MPLPLQVSAVDAAFASLNATLPDIYGMKDLSRPSSQQGRTATANNHNINNVNLRAAVGGASGLLGWNVVTAGSRQSSEARAAKRENSEVGAEKRQLQELQKRMDRERRKKVKAKRREMKEYEQQKGVLEKREFEARMEKRPRKWDVRASHDIQKRRANLKKLTGGTDFTSLVKPASLQGSSKLQLEPVLQHWMPQFAPARLTASVSSEMHRENIARQRQVKACVQRQRWVMALNSDETTGFNRDQTKNMEKIFNRGPKLGALTGLVTGSQGKKSAERDSEVIQQLKQHGVATKSLQGL